MLGNEVESDGVESHGISHGGFVAVRRRSVRKRPLVREEEPGAQKEQTKTSQIYFGVT